MNVEKKYRPITILLKKNKDNIGIGIKKLSQEQNLGKKNNEEPVSLEKKKGKYRDS